MDYADVFFWAFIAQVAFVASILGLLALGYYRIVRRYYEVENEKIIEIKKAGDESVKKLRVAQKESERIVSEAHIFEEEINSMVSKHLSNVMNNIGSNLLVSLSREAARQEASLTAVLQKQIAQILDNTSAQMSGDLAKVHQEIEEYKKAKMVEVEGKINNIIQKVIIKAVGQGMSTNEHEEIVRTALNDAKDEEFF
jgi:hypothetical protein